MEEEEDAVAMGDKEGVNHNGEGEGEGKGEGKGEGENDEVRGEVAADRDILGATGLMTSKLNRLVEELRRVQAGDSTAKCLVFSQFTQVRPYTILSYLQVDV